MHFKKITEVNLKSKIVFIRTDMNVPLKDGIITDDTRIKASLPTIKYALDSGAKVIIATHLGRPQEGECTKQDSVKPIADNLSHLLSADVSIVTDIDNQLDFTKTNIVMLENVRCNIGEKKNSSELGQKYAKLCDVFVHDAFATAHRAEASTDSVGQFAKEVCAGLLMSQELDALKKVSQSPKKPVVAIVAGSKVSTKLTILENLADKVDVLIVGGGILNTFLSANGTNVGKSLFEPDLVLSAKSIMEKMQARGAVVPLPAHVVVAKEFSGETKAFSKTVSELDADDMILDIGIDFAHEIAQIISKAGTIIWNGPVGVFEFNQFAKGTEIIANSIANSSGFSLAGGGDTIAAINKFRIFDKISYVSTAGGALLEFLEGKKLPAIALLEQKGSMN
ncbi:MAG: phosphoglycerate kinase [Neisseriaceae bacterium]